MEVANNIMQLQEILITPVLAEEMLKCNLCNRAISKSSVYKYSELMKKGEWYLSHQAIAFADTSDGREVLVDGQHRLAAVIQAGVPIKFTVIKHAVQTPYIDTPRSRNFIDNLNIFNGTKKYTSTMKGIINLLMQINKKKTLTQNERQCICDYYYETFKKIDEIYKSSTTKSGGYPLKTALFITYNDNYKLSNSIDEKLKNYMYIFNTGNVSFDDEKGIFIKEMRDYYYLQNREFHKTANSNSISYKRKTLTSIFSYSIECYLKSSRYLYTMDMESSLQNKVAKQLDIINYVSK
jgi:hypothetical protein